MGLIGGKIGEQVENSSDMSIGFFRKQALKEDVAKYLLKSEGYNYLVLYLCSPLAGEID